jgi:DNA-binding CsgD family transcriptional regulator
VYDASDVERVRVTHVAVDGANVPPEAIVQAVETADAEYVRATWRSVPCAFATETPGVERQPGWAHMKAAGVADILAINGADPSGIGVWLGVLLTQRRTLSAKRRDEWSRVAAHLAAGLRLRRRLRALGEESAALEAVLDGEGRVHHAEGQALEKPELEALRGAAIGISRARGPLRHEAPGEALGAWKALVDARWSLVDRVDADGRRYLVARRNEPVGVALECLTARERQVASYVSFGHTNKVIAYELGISHSTVRVLVARAARKLGAASREELSRLVAEAALTTHT